jgi:hypothetical protein
MSGPLAYEDLLRGFQDPPRKFSPVPIWWWSGETVTAERLRWQLERYAAGGVHNLVILNLAAAGPMYGCDADDPPFFSEAWWQLFLGACADAQRLGLRLWFYDQIGFSGANLQGRLVSDHPDWAAQALEAALVEPGVPPASAVPPRGSPIGSYVEKATGATRVVYTVDRGFDYFNAAACGRLIDTVHGEFERRAGRYLGSVIAGSFQDELPSMPQWSPGFAAAFARQTGYSILDRLAALWEDAPGADQVRLDYHRVRAALAEQAFFIPLFRWHEKHGLLCGCDQQSPSRAAEPVGGTLQYGDYARTHRWYGAPGSDHDGHAKLHSSLAHLYARPRVWLEAFHSTGWGGTLEETFDWLLPWLRAGITLYAPHADYYSTRGGWWEWAAPSTCWRQPYWKHYPLFASTIARLCWLLSRGHHACDIAVLYPTSTVQAGATLSGPTERARRAQEAWRQLTGSMKWSDFRPGWLDEWCRDYDALDEDSLRRAEVREGKLVIGEESFSTLILPACSRLPDGVGELLERFVAAGGNLVALQVRPDGAPAGTVFAQTAEECAAAVKLRPALVESPLPTLHRRADGLNLLLVTATAGMATRVKQPPREWWARRAYDFEPGRYATSAEIAVRAAGGAPFLLDPFAGTRRPVAWRRTPEGFTATVPFDHGPAMLLAWPDDAEAAPAQESPAVQRLEKEVATLSNAWNFRLAPTIDNRHGDFTRPAQRGSLPVQTWTFRHRVEASAGQGVAGRWFEADRQPDGCRVVQAGFGRRGWRRGPLPLGQLEQAPWQEVVYSLTRGLFKDPVHQETLGPKGHVAEDFIHFGTTRPGEAVRFRAGVWLEGPLHTHLALGAAGAKRAWVNDRAFAESGSGFLWMCPVDLRAGWNAIEWEVAPEVEVNLRAYWALVDRPKSFMRPEWMIAADEPAAHTRVRFSTSWSLPRKARAATLQLACDAPCRLLLDGVEVGRQGGFDPYKIGMRLERYELGPMGAGAHDITVEARDIGRPVLVLVDARTAEGALLMSGPGWWYTREASSPRASALHRPQFKEIGWSHLWRRPHPLPGSAWLEGAQPADVVRALEPDAPPLEPQGAEWLFWNLPPGARGLQLPVASPARLWVDGMEVAVEETGYAALPEETSARVRIASARVEPARGRYGGGLLDGPVTYELQEGRVETGDWLERGLDCYAGGVTYSQELVLPETPDVALTLDLGRVRGTAEVAVNGRPAGARFLSPYRFPVGHLLHAGANTLEVTIFNTLAPWLETHSPTRCIWEGTCAGGLLGPVRLLAGVADPQGPESRKRT